MTTPIRVDIISDVVCPWCIVGYRQLKQASQETGIEVEPYWHPFELNPDMVPEGEDLREHVARKYGSTAEQSAQARQTLQGIGASLGIAFAFGDNSRIYNTFEAHQLLHWAQDFGRTHDLKQAFLTAYFEDGKNVSDRDTLVGVVESIGLDAAEARSVLEDARFAEAVREKEHFWTSRGVSGVPTMIFNAKHATSGAQGVETFSNILRQISAMSQTPA
ncbi:DsbA family oxidoreductase [Shimia thalassica]|uniref:DsbA family oxidoreductase n=1 Tax=Shimia thalassica TaxID=1715693 RepID=UPI001C0A351C|nr:DsbA family oxidoreductase [Shimia thalassica]MBU2941879.1 DsbA family oxidoreductase [Shimia thalassica]MDO6505218.1 DsbA family oxidoreductase [Shimia thalassica]